jgi:transposase
MTLFPIKTDQPTDENKPSATPIKIPFLSGPALFESDSFVVEKIFLESEVARLKAIIEELAKENCRKNEVFKDLTAHLEKIELLNSELLNENSELRHHAETLLSENNELQKKLSDALEKLGEPKKNSTNSHIRPSGDITRKPKPQPENGEKRKKGGQPGHPRHERPPVDPDDIDFSYFYKPLEGQTCSCGEEMERAPESDQVQHQIDMIENPVINLEHRGLAYKCPSCGNIHLGTIPDEIVNQGLVAPKLAAFMGSLNLTGHCSIRNIQEILGHFHTTLSIGQISKTLFKLAKALNSPYLELLELLYRQRVLYVDETGWKENGKKIWTWGFNAKDFTVFVIGFRSADILVNVLGNDFQGVISCDYYSSYRSYFTKNPNATPSFCHGHIIRDFKFCQDHLDPETHQYGEKLLGIEKNLFELWHKFSEEPTEELFKALKGPVRK